MDEIERATFESTDTVKSRSLGQIAGYRVAVVDSPVIGESETELIGEKCLGTLDQVWFW
jgi:hypothetical protein